MAITSSKEVADPSLTQFACVSLLKESNQDFQGIPCACVSLPNETSQDFQGIPCACVSLPNESSQEFSSPRFSRDTMRMCFSAEREQPRIQ